MLGRAIARGVVFVSFEPRGLLMRLPFWSG